MNLKTIISALNLQSILSIILYTLIGFGAYKLILYLIEKISHNHTPQSIHWKFIRQSLKMIIGAMVVYSVMDCIPALKSMSTAILAGSSILIAAVGLASQESLGNAVSGLMISIFKPFAVGDRVRLVNQGLTGIIEDINIRHTVICTIENNRLLIPNSMLNKEVLENSNYTDCSICNFIDVSITYDSDLELAKKIMVEAVSSHSLFIDRRTKESIDRGDPILTVNVRNIADGRIELRVGAWTKTISDNFTLCSDVRQEILHKFKKNNIELYTQNSLSINNKN